MADAIETPAAAAAAAPPDTKWVHWFLKVTFSDFWDTKYGHDDKREATKVIRFRVPTDVSKKDEETKAMTIGRDLFGPSWQHLDDCDYCCYEDCDDWKHYFGVTKFHIVEKLPDVLPTEDSEEGARRVQEKIERECPRVSQARADHKRQQELVKFRKALAEKEKRHQQEVEKLKKRFGVE